MWKYKKDIRRLEKRVEELTKDIEEMQKKILPFEFVKEKK